jgi:hypothetical protein
MPLPGFFLLDLSSGLANAHYGKLLINLIILHTPDSTT